MFPAIIIPSLKQRFSFSLALAGDGNKAENEVFLLGDMNLDCYNDRWLNPDYYYFRLANLLQLFCERNNFDQLVNGITRTQFNSVRGVSDISCIDHIYTNATFRCSTPIIHSFGDSDHDAIGFVRLSKEPAEPAKTIIKRSYKHFNKEQFLEHLSFVDWSNVYRCQDLDDAVETFTNIFNEILDSHAPWVIFQNHKNSKPWITEETLEIMKKRDQAKEDHKRLSLIDSSSRETKDAWELYKILRNRVTHLKRNEEDNYKRKQVENNSDSAGEMWSTVK